jgi:hypothetical protein
LVQIGVEKLPMTVAEFDKFFKDDVTTNLELVKAANIPRQSRRRTARSISSKNPPRAFRRFLRQLPRQRVIALAAYDWLRSPINPGSRADI